MGAVYLARDDRLGRAVAVKTLRPELAARAGAVERFLREARATAAVEHDNIIPIWQVGEDAGIPFIAMPLLQGESLADRLKREPAAPADLVLKVGREVAEGLAAAHARGLIHRDIKPGNIWLEADPEAAGPAPPVRRAKILDFGLARPANDEAHITGSGVVVGTPAYMAPEQAAGESVDHRTDLFSLGAVLYRMATGEQPFPGRTVMAVLSALAHHAPKRPSEANPAIPPALSELIMRLISKDPASRPASAREVAVALAGVERHLASGRDSGTNPIGTGGRKRARPGRRQWVAAGLVAFVVFVVGVIVIKVVGPDGKETTVEVPEGSRVKVDEKGNVKVELPADRKPPVKEDAELGPKPPPKQNPVDHDRRAAAWVLDRGGGVTIRVGDREVAAKTPAELPARPFSLVKVSDFRPGSDGVAAGVSNLVGCESLRFLYLSYTDLTDDAFESIGKLPNLEWLEVCHTRKLTGSGLRHLKECRGIQQLVFHNTEGLTDAGMAHLEGLRLAKLTSLDLDGSPVTDKGLGFVKGFTGLTTLRVPRSRVTDEGLVHLGGLTNLTLLDLADTGVTDAGLAHLKGLPNLIHLDLTGTKVTAAGVEELRKALPKCKIEADPPKP